MHDIKGRHFVKGCVGWMVHARGTLVFLSATRVIAEFDRQLESLERTDARA